MIIRLADSNDTLSISQIWRECFTNDQSYIDTFIKHCFPYTKTFVIVADGTTNAVSSITLIPSYAIINGKKTEGGYLYAVGTLPQHRGKSYSKIITRHIFDYARICGLGYIVVKPATESLYNLYSSLSFGTTLFNNTLTLQCSSFLSEIEHICSYKTLNKLIETKLNSHDLFKLREKSFNKSLFLWTEDILKYSITEALYRGGVFKCYKTDYAKDSVGDKIIYFIAYPDDISVDIIKVIEHNAQCENHLYYLIEQITTIFSNAKTIVFEGICPSVSANLSKNVHIKTKQRAGLLKTFTDPYETEIISNFTISLPME